MKKEERRKNLVTKEEHVRYIEKKSDVSRKKFEQQMKSSLFTDFEKLLQQKKSKEIDNADLS